MATRIIGKVAFRPRGNWNGNVTDYERLDTVVDSNVMYIALQDVPVGTPVSDSTYWQRCIDGFGGSAQLDTEMSDVSTNGVQNKVIKEYVDGELRLKVTKENGKGLSTNDYTDSDKKQVMKIGSKVDKEDGKSLSTNDYTDADKNAVATIGDKVDKEDGKVLSSNDYTNEDKALVDTIDGKVENTGAGAVELISKLSSSTAEMNDNTYMIVGGTTYIRKKITLLWNYIKAKILGDVDIVKASNYFHQNGDVIQTNLVSCPAFLTSSSKSAIFSLPISKSLENINSVTINSMKGSFRSSMGYLHEQQTSSEWLGLENITITVDIEKPTNTLLFRVATSASFVNAPANNTPMSFYGTFKLTLSSVAPKIAPTEDTSKK